jgi:phosphopentomutase
MSSNAAPGMDVLGNKASSGTEIIKELGEEHAHRQTDRVYLSGQRLSDRGP